MIKVCLDCGVTLPMSGSGEHLRKRCSPCATIEKMRLKRLTAQRWREANRQAIRDRTNAGRAALRREVFQAYGGHCACPGCHVHHIELMTLDHVNGGGNWRRAKSRGVGDFYKKVKAAGFPPDFQLLCGSCNLAKSDGPACPLAGQDH